MSEGSMTENNQQERWVNAVIELTIPMDAVSPEDSPPEKQEAVGVLMGVLYDELPEAFDESVSSGHWEDVDESVEPPSPDPLAALREAERWEGFGQRECGEHRTLGGRAWCYDCSTYCYPSGPCLGCELPTLRSALQATEPLIAENEELRRERDQWRRAANGDRDGLVTNEYHCRVIGSLVAARKAAEADLDSARSTSEALAGALEELARMYDPASNSFGAASIEDFREAHRVLARYRSALDSARTPTEENPNG